MIRKEIMSTTEEVISVKMASRTKKAKPAFTKEEIENME